MNACTHQPIDLSVHSQMCISVPIWFYPSLYSFKCLHISFSESNLQTYQGSTALISAVIGEGAERNCGIFLTHCYIPSGNICVNAGWDVSRTLLHIFILTNLVDCHSILGGGETLWRRCN